MSISRQDRIIGDALMEEEVQEALAEKLPTEEL